MGLNNDEVIASRKKYGSNIIKEKTNNSFLHLLLESLGDPIIKILLIALGIKVIFLFKSFDWYETVGIVIAIFLASFISSISEYGSNKAFEHLQEETSNYKTLVYRNGKLIQINATDVVVGDIVKITSGMKIPADGNVKEGKLIVDESFLTGETKEISKEVNEKVYGGTLTYEGEGIIVITAVGVNSYIGSVSKTLQEKDEISPLKKKLRVLAGQISVLGYVGAILASLSYIFIEVIYNNHFDINLIIATITNKKEILEILIYALTLSVTIIIMAVPEGLPMMITLVLSSNMKKMLKDNILVRKLVGIETSGSLNVLLCDKTGTLTEGKLKVKKLLFNGFETDNINYLSSAVRDIILKSFILNNESTYSSNKVIGGNSTDKAILEFIGDIKIKDKINEKVPFNSKQKYSYIKSKGKYFIKGSSEEVLPKCKKYLNNQGKEIDVNYKELEIKHDFEARKGQRIITVAYGENLEKLTFVCFIILADKIRKETKKSIEMIEKAGIHMIMITGDDKNTALNIGTEIGLYKGDNLVLTHDDLIKLSDNEIKNIFPKIKIIARSLPKDKERMVNIAKSMNYVVGMTGDGVNDALALKKSDVGFSMGSGSEVAKEASDIVIVDNNIFSICKAILYGRTIFKSIRKFVVYQLTVNICALLLSVIGILIGISTPITIVQMLWLNMIMDTFAGLAFSYEPALDKYMLEKPKQIKEKIINSYMKNEIIIDGIFCFLICILFLKLPIVTHFIRKEKLTTAFFALFIFLGIINSFLARTTSFNLLKDLLKNKVFIIINVFIIFVQILIIYYGGDLFRTYGLNIEELFYVILLSLVIIPIDLIRKILLNKNGKINV